MLSLFTHCYLFLSHAATTIVAVVAIVATAVIVAVATQPNPLIPLPIFPFTLLLSFSLKQNQIRSLSVD